MSNGRTSATRLACTLAILFTWWLLAVTAVLAAEEGGRRTMGVVDILLLPRVWMGAIFCLVGLVLLAKAWVGRGLRVVALVVVFVAFAVLSVLPLGSFARGMGLHPSPVCAITRPFQFVEAGRSIPVIFFTILGVIAVLSVVGNKLFCGWVCPLGALQEILQRISLSKKWRERIRFTLPFRVTNTIRALTFAGFVVVVFTASRSIYDYFNPFEFFHWGFETSAIIILAVTMVAAVFMFRPFCYLACPIGLFTWILEHVSFTRIRVNHDECNMCEACIKLTNCPSVAPALDGKRSRPDCHACGQCMAVCPKDALQFK